MHLEEEKPESEKNQDKNTQGSLVVHSLNCFFPARRMQYLNSGASFHIIYQECTRQMQLLIDTFTS